MSKRKIIQITAHYASGYGHMLFALCDDGTVWRKLDSERHGLCWMKLPQIPLLDEEYDGDDSRKIGETHYSK